MTVLEQELRAAAEEWWECCDDIHLLLLRAADALSDPPLSATSDPSRNRALVPVPDPDSAVPTNEEQP